MGNSTSQSTPPPTISQEHRLNTRDLEDALDLILTMGNPRNDTQETFQIFNYIINARDSMLHLFSFNSEFQHFMESEVGRRLSQRVVTALDADGDGRLTPRDFQIMYDRDLKNILRRHQRSLDQYLPFIGQCCFGLGCGYLVGALARRLYKGRNVILISGIVGYSGLQYLAQLNFVNQQMLEVAFKEKIRELADVNGDGELNREDINALVENRMRFIATKLGPGGIAPGAVGYMTLGVGLLRGLRRI